MLLAERDEEAGECFQAGALFGMRHANLPAYHWYDREIGKEIHMNVPADACKVEARLRVPRGTSLLEDGGTSYLSLFRADATNQMCMVALADTKQMLRSIGQQLRGVRGPRRRNVFRFLGDIIQDSYRAGMDVFRWARRIKDWRHEKEYFFNRFFMMSMGWNLSHTRALIDMVQGVPAIYLVFGNFDEVAHRRGPLSIQARSELYRADAAFEELYALSQSLDNPYDIVFVTDHGHVDSSPFEKRTGTRLKSLLLDGPDVPLSADIERALLDARDPLPKGPPRSEDEPVVVEAGNFSHVYLSRKERALEAERFCSSASAGWSRAR